MLSVLNKNFLVLGVKPFIIGLCFCYNSTEIKINPGKINDTNFV